MIRIVGGLCAVVAITMLAFGDYNELRRFVSVVFITIALLLTVKVAVEVWLRNDWHDAKIAGVAVVANLVVYLVRAGRCT